ncbi:MAG: hypothetical protein LBF93_03165 [Zoogloeaceae bacterium]|jgi:hypothetical protein|nr:hypothetical protein [Zoogloeaceae bacterium]
MRSWKYLAGLSAVMVLTGCGEGSVPEQAGSTIGGTVVDFASGLGKGVDEKMLVELELESSVAEYGLAITVGKNRDLGSGRTAVYVVTEKPFTGAMLVKALDASGNEIGRATSSVTLKQDDAAYVDLLFPPQMDSNLVRKYRVSVRLPAEGEVIPPPASTEEAADNTPV